tara:strand:+ start:38 stop:469 length:432 start_codon:yes stop_codon:yes gene_type:complete
MAFNLKEMFSNIQSSIVEAAHTVEGEVFKNTKARYFDEQPDGSFHPKTVKLNLPQTTSTGKVIYNAVDIPLFTLAKHNSLSLDEVHISFEIDLKHDDDSTLKGTLAKGFLSRKSAKVELKFKGAEASEGVMLLNDKIQQTIPR